MMQPLFTDAGKQRLSEIARDGLLCTFDFDGTLAPIMPRPEQVRLPDLARDMLVALSAHAPIAIITGRALADIRGRLGFVPDFLIGNHGMEGVPGWEVRAAGHAQLCAGWKAQLLTILRPSAGSMGIMVEDKRYSLSVHYRNAPDHERAAAVIEGAVAKLTPCPRLVAGKFIVNLVAEDACHKGSALEALVQTSGARSAIYVGDDVTDEDVFRIKRPDLLSIRVEPGVDSAADFFVQHPAGMTLLLEDLTNRLRECRAQNWLRSEAASGA